MSSAAVIAAITDRLEGWTATNVREPNGDFKPGKAPFVEVSFPPHDQARGAIGDAENPLWQEDGAFMCHVFVPRGSGVQVAAGLADALADLFLRWDAPPTGLTIWKRLPGTDGDRDVGGAPWFGVSFGITYTYQSIG